MNLLVIIACILCFISACETKPPPTLQKSSMNDSSKSSFDADSGEPLIAKKNPTIQPGQKIQLWIRNGPEQLFQENKNVFVQHTTIVASETPFGEGGVTSKAVYDAVFSSQSTTSQPTLWAKSLTVGEKVSGAGISVDSDPTAGLGNYVGKTADGTLVMLLELGPDL